MYGVLSSEFEVGLILNLTTEIITPIFPEGSLKKFY